MKKGWNLTQEAFDYLLEWLSPEREKAGEAYERIRTGLIKLFLIRGCGNPEVLADETINRVVSKLPDLRRDYQGDPVRYFYNVAGKIYLESVSANQNKEEQLGSTAHSKLTAASPAPPDADPRLEYLKQCLQKLAAEDRELVAEYFAVDGSPKFEHRRLITEKRNTNLNSLRIRIVRLKKKLHDCVVKKMQK